MKVIRYLSGRSATTGYGWSRIADGCAFPFRPNYRLDRNCGQDTGDGLPPIVELAADGQLLDQWIIGQHHYVTTRIGNNGEESRVSQYKFTQFFFLSAVEPDHILQMPLLLQSNMLSIKEYQEISEKNTTPYPPVDVSITENVSDQHFDNIEEAAFVLTVWQRCWERYTRKSIRRLIVGLENSGDNPGEKLNTALLFSANKLSILFPDIVKRIISIAYGVPKQNTGALEQSILVFIQDPNNEEDALFDAQDGKLKTMRCQLQTEEEKALAEALYRGIWPPLYLDMKRLAPDNMLLHANYLVLITLSGLDLLPLSYERIESVRKILEQQLAPELLFTLLLKKEKQLLEEDEARDKSSPSLIPSVGALKRYFRIWAVSPDGKEEETAMRYLASAQRTENEVGVLEKYLTIALHLVSIQDSLDSIPGFIQGAQKLCSAIKSGLTFDDYLPLKNIFTNKTEKGACIDRSAFILNFWDELVTDCSDDLCKSYISSQIDDTTINNYLDLLGAFQPKADTITPLLAKCTGALRSNTINRISTRKECSEESFTQAALQHLEIAGANVSAEEINSWRESAIGKGKRKKEFNMAVQKWFEMLPEIDLSAKQQARQSCTIAIIEGWQITGDRNQVLRREILRDMFNQEFSKRTDLQHIIQLYNDKPYLKTEAYEEVFPDSQPASTATDDYTDRLVGDRNSLSEGADLISELIKTYSNGMHYPSLLYRITEQIRKRLTGEYCLQAIAKIIRESDIHSISNEFVDAEANLRFIEGDTSTDQTRKARTVINWVSQLLKLNNTENNYTETDANEAIHIIIGDPEIENLLNLSKSQGAAVFYPAAITLAKLKNRDRWPEQYWKWVASDEKNKEAMICFTCRHILRGSSYIIERKCFIDYVSKTNEWNQLYLKFKPVLKAQCMTLELFLSEET